VCIHFIFKSSGPIVEKNGKVRHFKSLDEKIPDQPHQGILCCLIEFAVENTMLIKNSCFEPQLQHFPKVDTLL
jgi:hypothetical protein